jgi:argininosuccinate lyase
MGIIDQDCLRALETALDRIEQEARAGSFPPSGDEPEAAEDVHSA